MAADDSGRTDLAEARAREATRIFPSAAEFRFHLGNILGKRSEFDSAEEMYLEAISIGDIDGGDAVGEGRLVLLDGGKEPLGQLVRHLAHGVAGSGTLGCRLWHWHRAAGL